MTEEQPKTLYVWGLNRDLTQEKLKEEFDKVAKIKRCTIICNKETGKSKGFGYVECESSEDASKAFAEMEDKVISDYPIHIKYSYSETPEWVKNLNDKDGPGDRGRGRGRGFGRGRGVGRGRGGHHDHRENFDNGEARNGRFNRDSDSGYRGRGDRGDHRRGRGRGNYHDESYHGRGDRGDFRGGRGRRGDHHGGDHGGRGHYQERRGGYHQGRDDYHEGRGGYDDGRGDHHEERNDRHSQGGYRGRGDYRGSGHGPSRGRGDYQNRDDRFSHRGGYGREDNDRYGRHGEEHQQQQQQPHPYSRYDRPRHREEDSYGRGAYEEERQTERRPVDNGPYGNKEYEEQGVFDSQRKYDQLAEAAPLRRRPTDSRECRLPPREHSYGESSGRYDEKRAPPPRRSPPGHKSGESYRDPGHSSQSRPRPLFPERHEPMHREQAPARNRSPQRSRYTTSTASSGRRGSRSPIDLTRETDTPRRYPVKERSPVIDLTGDDEAPTRYPVKERARDTTIQDSDYAAALRVAEAVKSLASTQPRRPISLESYPDRLHPSLRGAIERNAESYTR